MRKAALALIMIGMMVTLSFVVLGGSSGDETEFTFEDPDNEGSEKTRETDRHDKVEPYDTWDGWDLDDWDDPMNQNWHNWSNFLPHYPQREFWLRCKNMTEDLQWLDDVNDTTNGDEVGMMKEDLNLTQTEDDPMNFSYPRADKKLTARYDSSWGDIGVCNLTINPLGLLSMGANPLMGRGKQIMMEVWVDTDGDYNYENPDENPSASIEGIMRFDFNWWDTPYDPRNINTLEPYTTNASEMHKTGRQMEEHMDGIGYWLDLNDDDRPDIPGDINQGRIWVLLWRVDNQPDDLDSRTMDLLIYCGYNHKLSWIALPYLHPRQIPVADTGEDLGFPENKEEFLREKNDPLYEDPVFTEEHPQIKEGETIVFNGTLSYDPQDDVGADGIGYGDPDWPGSDRGEGNNITDDGIPLGTPDYGETDNLKYHWVGETSINDNSYKITLTTGYQTNPYFEWKVRLPAMDASLPADEQYLIVNVTLTVQDPDLNEATHTIQVLAFKSQHAPRVSLSVTPQIPEVFKGIGEAYVLVQQDVRFDGSHFDPDPASVPSYHWKFEGPFGTMEREGPTFVQMRYEEPGNWTVTVTVYDGPLDSPNTLNGTAVVNLHVVENKEPVPVIRASHNPPNWQYEEFHTKKGQTVVFNGSESYDPDIWVPTPEGDEEGYWVGLQGFDEDGDSVPDIGLKYQWDWGDDTRTESFVSDAQAEKSWIGEGAPKKQELFWPVTLKVWDGRVITTSEEFRVYVNLPPTAEAGPTRPTPVEGEIEEDMEIRFDGSGSYDFNDDPNNDRQRGSGYVDRLNYSWDFGDGSRKAYGRVVYHTYDSHDTYEVRLVVSDGDFSDDDTCNVRITPANKPPEGVVSITADEWLNRDDRTLLTKIKLTFDASESFDPDGEAYLDDQVSTTPIQDLIGLTWDLGDGTVIQKPKVEKTYEQDGIYNVTVNMSDIKGAIWSETYQITVVNRAPVAVIKESSVTYTFEDQPVMLSGDGSTDTDGEIIGYYWEFGDGTYSDLSKNDGYQPSKVTSHRYEKTGKYTAKLLVKDDDGAVSEEAAVIEVVIVSDPGGEDDSPLPAAAILGGLLGTVAIMALLSASFGWFRKRS